MAASQKTDVGAVFTASASDAAVTPNANDSEWLKIPVNKMSVLYGAELEVIRSALPRTIVRCSVDIQGKANRGRATCLYARSNDITNEEELLIIWRVEIQDASQQYIGFACRRKDGSDVRLLPPNFPKNKLPEIARESAFELGSEHFPWRGPTEAAYSGAKESETKEPTRGSNSNADNPYPSFQKTVTELRAQVQSLKERMESGLFPFCPVAPRERERWWNTGCPLDQKRISDLFDYIMTSALRYDFLPYAQQFSNIDCATEFVLPFYQGYSLFEFSSSTGGHSVKHYIVANNKFLPNPICALTGHNLAINEFNAKLAERGELDLRHDTVIDYLSFFCRFLQAHDGPFWIVEDYDEMAWDDSKTIEPTTREIVTAVVKPACHLVPDNAKTLDNMIFHVGSFLTYSEYVFYCHFAVTKRAGDRNKSDKNYPLEITMIDSSPCLSALPLLSRKWTEEIVTTYPNQAQLNDRFLLRAQPKSESIFSIYDQSRCRDSKTTERRVRTYLQERSVFNFTYPEEGDPLCERVRTEAYTLPFYDGYSLYRITDRRGPYAKAYFAIIHDENSSAPECFLNGSKERVISFNRALRKLGQPPNISSETVSSYLTFFVSPCAIGRENRRTFLARLSDIRWMPQAGKGSAIKKTKIEREFDSPKILAAEADRKDGDSAIEIVACCYSARGFYRAQFSVQDDGNVEISSGYRIVDDPPCIAGAWDKRFYGVFRND